MIGREKAASVVDQRLQPAATVCDHGGITEGLGGEAVVVARFESEDVARR